MAALLPQLHIVGREEPISALAHPTPPAIVNHFYVGDDVIRIKGDLIIASSLVVIQGDGCDAQVTLIPIVGVILCLVVARRVCGLVHRL